MTDEQIEACWLEAEQEADAPESEWLLYGQKVAAKAQAEMQELLATRDARIAELERWKAAVESEMAANWQSIGLYSSAPPGSYACGYRQGCISSLTALRAAIERATKP